MIGESQSAEGKVFRFSVIFFFFERVRWRCGVVASRLDTSEASHKLDGIHEEDIFSDEVLKEPNNVV